MVTQLVRDHIRRMWRFYAWILALLTLLWSVLASTGHDASAIDKLFALPMVFLAGPLLTIGAFTSREVTMLPVSRREIWRALWLLGTVFIATGMMVARVGGSVIGHAFELERVVSPGVLAGDWLIDFTYCGVCFGIFALLTRSPFRAWLARRDRVLGIPKPLLLIAVPGLLFAGGFIFRAFFYTNWRDDLWGLPGLVLALGLILTIIGARHRPAITARSAPGRPHTAENHRPARALVISEMKTGRSGISLLLWRQVRIETVFAMAVVTQLFLFAMAIPPHSGLARLTETFGSGMFDHSGLVVKGGWLLKSSWIWLLLFNQARLVGFLLPHLRVLPISRARLNGLLLASGVPYWFVAIATFTAIHLVMTGTLPRIDVSAMLLAAGLGACAHGLVVSSSQGIKIAFSGLVMLGLACLVGLVQTVVLRRLVPMFAEPWAFGILLFAMAAFSNHRALRRHPSRRERVALACAELA